MSQHNGDSRSIEIQPEQLTAYALGQLRGQELAAVKSALGEQAGEASPTEVREVQALAAAITAARNAEPLPKPSVELRAGVDRQLDKVATKEPFGNVVHPLESSKPWWRLTVVEYVVIGGICCVLIGLLLPAVQASREAARRVQAANNLKQLAMELEEQRASRVSATSVVTAHDKSEHDLRYQDSAGASVATLTEGSSNSITWQSGDSPQNRAIRPESYGGDGGLAGLNPPAHKIGAPVDHTQDDATKLITVLEENKPLAMPGTSAAGQTEAAETYAVRPPVAESAARNGGRGRGGRARGGQGGMVGSPDGGRGGGAWLRRNAGRPDARWHAGAARGPGMAGGGIASTGPSSGGPGQPLDYDPYYERAFRNREGESARQDFGTAGAERSKLHKYAEGEARLARRYQSIDGYAADASIVAGEQYVPIVDNQFLAPTAHPLSTFSIDVDTASYANVRRFLTGGQLPPPDALRIEELVNYFSYSYPQPMGSEPFSVNMETAECPWRPGHLLLRVGLKGKEIHRSERPPSNLTFLLDVSGSMQDENKLPLLKTTLMMLVAELTENDRVSIVTYAGEAGLRLPPTRGNEKAKIMAAIESLSAGGSTHGSAGIQLAYEQAGQYFLKEGTNRVILATDGDLNVGVTSDDALVQLIKEKATGGTFLTVLGFGTGNLKDGKLEKLADNGNGVYAYIDGVREGRKVLVEQMSGSLVTIAKDVKIQIEFNPREIASFRLLGYENRVLTAADFNNDKKDAGEIGAGHTVTALYELVPVGAGQVAAPAPGVDVLRYQEVGGQRSEVRGQQAAALTEAAASGELLTLKLRYKEPDGQASKLLEVPLMSRGGPFNAASKDLQFAAAVVSFGMILRGSEHRGSGNLPAVAEIASGAIGDDSNGYRAEFVDLVRKAQALGAK